MLVGIKIEFFLGQRVVITAEHARGKTGQLITLDMRGDDGIQATVVLDEPIVIPRCKDFGETRIHTQTLHILDIAPIKGDVE